jgi:hypothetical protein
MHIQQRSLGHALHVSLSRCSARRPESYSTGRAGFVYSPNIGRTSKCVMRAHSLQKLAQVITQEPQRNHSMIYVAIWIVGGMSLLAHHRLRGLLLMSSGCKPSRTAMCDHPSSFSCRRVSPTRVGNLYIVALTKRVVSSVLRTHRAKRCCAEAEPMSPRCSSLLSTLFSLRLYCYPASRQSQFQQQTGTH